MSNGFISVILKLNRNYKLPIELVNVVHIAGQLYEADVSKDLFKKMKIDPAIATIAQAKRASQGTNKHEYY